MLNFAKEIENMSAVEILNYYRNLYHADSSNTERGIVANAINDALSTIARQKAEIDKLDIELKAMRGAANSYKAEVERLKADNKIYIEANKVIGYQRDQRDKEIDELQKQIGGLDVRKNKIKAEAYKEFAEKLKEKRWDAECRVGYVQVVDVGDIDEVLKEMVGEEE